jgi:probable phosphoglycerate mutase
VTEILLIRHGETDWNAAKRLQGHLDIPLNAEGQRQALALGHALLGEDLDAIISSDLLRARQTAQQIAAPRGMTVQIDADLRERCYGAFEGMLYADIGVRYPEPYAAWKARDIDARFPPGVRIAETLREFSQRSVDAITRLAGQRAYRKIALRTGKSRWLRMAACWSARIGRRRESGLRMSATSISSMPASIVSSGMAQRSHSCNGATSRISTQRTTSPWMK